MTAGRSTDTAHNHLLEEPEACSLPYALIRLHEEYVTTYAPSFDKATKTVSLNFRRNHFLEEPEVVFDTRG